MKIALLIQDYVYWWQTYAQNSPEAIEAKYIDLSMY